MRRLATVSLFVHLAACAPLPSPARPPPSAPPPAPSTRSDAPTAPAGSRERPRFVIHVVDVGTGLGVFVQGPDFTLVYDAGSNDDLALHGANRFLAYLRAVAPRLRTIDHVVLSHPHRDHVELLPDVIAAYPPRHVWEPGVVNPICGYRRFLEAIAHSPGTEYHSAARDPGAHEIDFETTECRLPPRLTLPHAARVEEGKPIPLGRTGTMTFLHVDGVRHGDRYNESSLVALLDLDGARALLMGDAEAGGREDPSRPPTPRSIEGQLLTRHRAELDADVLIAGHHGSKSSSRHAFVEAVSPRVSVVSSGPARYQGVVLPDAEIVAELARAGQLLRTDVDDAACARNPHKTGPDADGAPGGCDHVRITIQAGSVSGSTVAEPD